MGRFQEAVGRMLRCGKTGALIQGVQGIVEINQKPIAIAFVMFNS